MVLPFFSPFGEMMTASSRKFQVTLNTSRSRSIWKNSCELALKGPGGVEAVFTEFKYRDDKDGTCIVPGKIVGGTRKAGAIEQIDLLIYDIDGGQPLDDIMEKVYAMDVYAIVHSSYNNYTSKTEISTNAFDGWAKRNNEKSLPTLESMLKYLHQHGKQHLTNVQFDISDRSKHFGRNPDGPVFIVHHDPLAKYRVIFPLKESIVLSDFSLNGRKQLESYEAVYRGVGQTVGLKFDEACKDPSRLFYTPAHPTNSPYEPYFYIFHADEDDPPLLDWKAQPRAVVESKQTKTTANGDEVRITNQDYIVKDKNGTPIDLRILARNAELDIEDALRNALPPDMIRKDRANGGFTLQCPFEDEHSTFGGDGFFASNGDEKFPWTMSCSHQSCKTAKRGRIDFLSEYIRQGYVTANDLGIVVEEKEAPITRDDVALALNVDPTTLPDFSAINKKDEELDLDAFEDKPDDGDERLSAEEVYESSLQNLTSARSLAEFHASLGRMRFKKCEIDPLDVANAVARSPLSGRLCRKGLGQLCTVIGVESSGAFTALRRAREQVKPLSNEVEQMYFERLTGMELESRIRDLADFYGCTPTELKSEYTKFYSTLIGQEYGEMIRAHFPSLNKRFAKLRQGSSVVFLDMEESRKKLSVEPYKKSDLFTWLQNKNVDVPTKKGSKKQYVATAWMDNSTEIQEYTSVTFDPVAERAAKDPSAFNLWDHSAPNGGFAIAPVEGDCSLILDHIKNVWCARDEAVYNWVITWFADIIQNPGRKPHTSLVLLGGQGTGKSCIFEGCFAPILDKMYGVSGDREDLVGRWGGHLFAKLLFLAEEVLFSGDKRSMHKLKDLISRDTVGIERKGIDKITVPSFTRFVFTGNEMHALHLDKDDRRFCVLRTLSDRQQDQSYFKPLLAYIKEGGGPAHLLHYLMNWNPETVGLNWQSLNTPPVTDAKAEQIEMSRDPGDQFFVDLIRYGRIAGVPPGVFTQGKITWPLDYPASDLGEDSQFIISTTRFNQCFDEFLLYRSPHTARYDRNHFPSLFSVYIGKGKTMRQASIVKRVGGRATRCIVLPPRREMLDYALEKRLISRDDYNMALQDTDSHLYPDASDVL